MDSIFALSTPPGKSGIAVVRVSGALASASLRALGIEVPPPRVATLATLHAPSLPLKREGSGEAAGGGEKIDKALVLYFPAPHSFTGEDIIEYHIHGSRAVIARLLAALTALPGLRPAEPGEFTRRAFLNGKMDLTAAEGLADLIDAETESQRRQALRFMQGEAAVFYERLRAGILEVLALTEAYIDFPDEEIPESVLAETRQNVQELLALIEGQLADKGAAERIRDGVQVAILGAPNAGKSSLMNLLAKRDVAIVSEVAGTTRDVIEVHLDIGGYAVVVADTAGIRESGDAIEREGVRRSLKRAEDADIRIVVLDAKEVASGQWPVASKDEITDHRSLITPSTILLLNKTDLALPSPLPVINGITPIAFSAVTRAGMEELMSALSEKIAALAAVESSFIARSRHRHHLEAALTHLRAYAASPSGLELQCEELRRAAVEIGRITGTIAADEVLGHIFSRFCIGK